MVRTLVAIAFVSLVAASARAREVAPLEDAPSEEKTAKQKKQKRASSKAGASKNGAGRNGAAGKGVRQRAKSASDCARENSGEWLVDVEFLGRRGDVIVGPRTPRNTHNDVTLQFINDEGQRDSLHWNPVGGPNDRCEYEYGLTDFSGNVIKSGGIWFNPDPWRWPGRVPSGGGHSVSPKKKGFKARTGDRQRSAASPER
jgi:hypothetical protein